MQGNWTCTSRGDVRRSKGPFAQAQGQFHGLTKRLRRQVDRRFPDYRGFPFSFGHAVAFPLTTVSDVGLPLNAHPRIAFDARDIDNIGEKVVDAMTYWRRAKSNHTIMSRGDFDG